MVLVLCLKIISGTVTTSHAWQRSIVSSTGHDRSHEIISHETLMYLLIKSEKNVELKLVRVRVSVLRTATENAVTEHGTMLNMIIRGD